MQDKTFQCSICREIILCDCEEPKKTETGEEICSLCLTKKNLTVELFYTTKKLIQNA